MTDIAIIAMTAAATLAIAALWLNKYLSQVNETMSEQRRRHHDDLTHFDRSIRQMGDEFQADLRRQRDDYEAAMRQLMDEATGVANADVPAKADDATSELAPESEPDPIKDFARAVLEGDPVATDAVKDILRQ